MTAVFFAGDIGRVNPALVGVDVDEMPGGDFAVRVEAGFNLDDRRRAEICPGEFLLARPAQRDGFARSLCETRRFHRALARVLPAKARATIAHHDAPAGIPQTQRA